MSTTLPHSSREMTPEAIRDAYQALQGALPAAQAPAAEWEAVFWRWNDLKCWISGEYSRRHYREMQDTRDEAAEAAMRYMRERIVPLMEEHDARLRQAFLASPARESLTAQYGKELFAKFELEQAAFAPENIELNMKEGDTASSYERMLGTATLEVGGETLTLTKTSSRLTDADAETRRTAWEAIAGWEAAHRARFHEIYDQLLALRQQMAANLKEPTFVPLGYRKMGRTDYGPEQVATFRQGIATYVSPVLAKLRESQARLLGTPSVKPWDQAYFPGLSLPPNVAPVDGQIAKAQALFDRLHPTLAGHFRRMVAEGLIDLENRPGKAPGAFATAYEDEGKVVIFCNSTGNESDVTTLTHEMGHAFQAWESRAIKPLELRWPTADACEIHSMGMEFLSLKEIGAFFTPEQAARFRKLKLIRTVTLLPYIATVDAFQHWVYEHPGHTHAEREAAWRSAWDTYMPGIDYGGHEDAKSTRWMRQAHIFVMPFYYIDYAIAEVGALQLWQLSEQNHDQAMEAYLNLCRIGGTRSVLGVFEAGGLKSPFDPHVLAPLMEAAARELEL